MSACLNKKGMALFGDIFPDGLIPVYTPLSGETELEGIGETQIYLINIPLLKKVDLEAYHKTLDRLSQKFNAPKDLMDKEFTENGLPLRSELVSCVKIDMRFVI
jgi:hypothetical protein